MIDYIRLKALPFCRNAQGGGRGRKQEKKAGFQACYRHHTSLPKEECFDQRSCLERKGKLISCGQLWRSGSGHYASLVDRFGGNFCGWGRLDRKNLLSVRITGCGGT